MMVIQTRRELQQSTHMNCAQLNARVEESVLTSTVIPMVSSEMSGFNGSLNYQDSCPNEPVPGKA